MTQRAVEDWNDDLGASLGLVSASVDEDRAAAIAKALRTRHDTHQLSIRAATAIVEAEEAGRLAVSALAEADGLRRAMQNRATIDMAKGVIIAIHGVDVETAFDVLRAESQRTHKKLSEVAAGILAAATAQQPGTDRRSAAKRRSQATVPGHASHTRPSSRDQ